MLKFSLKKKFQDCPCTGANLERFINPAILTLLVDNQLHGYSLVQKLQETDMLRNKKPDPAGVYRGLKLMEQRGHVTAVWDVSNSGPAKKLYSITDDGLECLKTWINTLDTYHNSLGLFLSFAQKTVLNHQD
ncbi:PadR family transcriptional regulator [Sporomusa sp. KB1]|jgi:poly-beta-hydroxybutyrate-responsive repressor|uniref:PadR family transcriptional regulator n=1 Tax=Sporomusa sp. KB1 TaxID=943346 RepID=UPI0011A6A586|nr:helix-turn-helix transcriptional regulator [Sporomusa sp. KB1]TWH48711.1 poly-beta-hydroxybutyrate-responsive repressor [Sporomusa sp. KB1]